jgi:hypothetical protein
VSLALLVPAALLVYPQSLEHYTVPLLVPLLLRRADDLGLPRILPPVLIAATFALVRYGEGTVAVLASAGLWLVYVALAAGLLESRARVESPFAPAVRHR